MASVKRAHQKPMWWLIGIALLVAMARWVLRPPRASRPLDFRRFKVNSYVVINEQCYRVDRVCHCDDGSHEWREFGLVSDTGDVGYLRYEPQEASLYFLDDQLPPLEYGYFNTLWFMELSFDTLKDDPSTTWFFADVNHTYRWGGEVTCLVNGEEPKVWTYHTLTVRDRTVIVIFESKDWYGHVGRRLYPMVRIPFEAVGIIII